MSDFNRVLGVAGVLACAATVGYGAREIYKIMKEQSCTESRTSKYRTLLMAVQTAENGCKELEGSAGGECFDDVRATADKSILDIEQSLKDEGCTDE